MMNPGRNDPCPCGSGRKFKKCCGSIDQQAPASQPDTGTPPLGAGQVTPVAAPPFPMALQHFRAGQLYQAEAVCQQILKAQPGNTDALHLLGVIAHQVGKNDVAVDLIGQAIAINPRVAEYHNNMGLALQRLGRFDEAARHYERALALKPGLADVHNNLGAAFREQGRYGEAIAFYERALKLQPGHAGVCNNLGNVLQELERFEEAIGYFTRAIALKPDYAEAHNNLGAALRELGRLEEARKHFVQALTLRPSYAAACYNLGTVLKDLGRFEEGSACYRQVLALKPDYNRKTYSNLLLRLNYLPGFDPATICEAHRRYAEIYEQPLAKAIQPHPNESSPGRRLKIGYVSPDFRRHSVAHFVEPVLKNHDRSGFEVFCYFCHRSADAMTRHLQSRADHWRDIASLSDDDAARLIREDGIDILVDLAGHTAGNRLLVFARKPASVQVAWLGYPNTTGLSAMDYRITDAYADPVGMTERFHTEQLLRLPECFSCYQPPPACPDVGKLPALEKGYLTFGSLNNLAKINPPVIELWAGILRAVPRSRLMLKHWSSESALRESLCAMFASLGIPAERLEFVGIEPDHVAHMQRHHDMDIGLDPFPYNGATTTCDALWMGIPVITLAGATHVARVGVSQMSNLGLAELIARSPEEYLEIAVRLAGDTPRLNALRAELRARMAASPLTDAPRFTRHLERAYREIWERWRAPH